MRASAILDPALEQQDPVTRRAYLGTRLRETVAYAQARSPHVRRAFDKAGIGPRDVASLDDLAKIPITRKDDVPAMQAAEPPFGGLLAVEPGRLQRIFASPGPILDPQGEGDDFWRFRMALAAAGFRRGDIAINSASYHLTPLGFMLDNAARSLGCVVVPAGVMLLDGPETVVATVTAPTREVEPEPVEGEEVEGEEVEGEAAEGEAEAPAEGGEEPAAEAPTEE